MAASHPALQSLEQQLEAYAKSKPGDHGIAALDLRTGELVGVRADEHFPMASTVKIAVAANYLAQMENGRRSLDTPIAGKPASALLEAMMIRSDNYATDLLLRNLGGPRTIQAWLDQRGVEGIRIDRTISQLLSDRRDLFDRRDSSTPTAMVNLLRRIDDGQLLRPSSRQYLLALMARCSTGKNRIRGLLPTTTPVEHKTGTLSGLTADVGFITLADGRRLAVAFFERNGNERPQTIAAAARAIYEGFTTWMTMQAEPVLAQ
ncbi:MAG: serine hydrolase [Sphingomicrobium sp.]